MTWVLVLFLVLSSILNLVLGVGIYNLLRSTEKYEDFITLQNVHLQTVLAQIRSIDLRGSFEADDEVGAVFKGIRKMIESLEVFLQPDDER